LADVLEGKVSVGAAKSSYGVAIDAKRLALDEAETVELREARESTAPSVDGRRSG
jgi:hypothetical protein